jgi:glycosyltransferase involved in cell wall biosynthesis
VPEVVDHGVTGFVCGDVDGLAAAVARLGAIDRGACRARVERLFSDVVVVESYRAVYAEMLACRTMGTAA